MIKLDAMENPYGLSGEARAEIAAAVANARINRYPDGGGDEVKTALRRALRLPDEVALVLGNGSDEILQMLTAVVAKPGRRRAGAGSLVRACTGCRRISPTCASSACRCAPISRSTRTRCWPPSRSTARAGVARVSQQSDRHAVSGRARHRAHHRGDAGPRRGRRGVLRVCRRDLPPARARISQPDRRAHAVEGRHGGRTAWLRGRSPRVDRRARQGAAAVQHQHAHAGGGAGAACATAICWPSRRQRFGASAHAWRPPSAHCAA